MSNDGRMDDYEDEWEVEKILDKSLSKYGRTLYLIKWKNFNDAASSWEPLENLCCADLIAEFEEELEKQSEAEAATSIDGASPKGVISSAAISSSGRPIHSNTPSPAHSRYERGSSVDSANEADQLQIGASRNEIVPVSREISPFPESFSSRHQENDLRRGEAKFERGYTVEKIVGAINDQDSISFLIKWKGRSECDLIRNKIARLKCPQLILDFYEKNIQWK